MASDLLEMVMFAGTNGVSGQITLTRPNPVRQDQPLLPEPTIAVWEESRLLVEDQCSLLSVVFGEGKEVRCVLHACVSYVFNGTLSGLIGEYPHGGFA
jgi:hypothetical protein